METEIILLITSLGLNALMILKDFVHRIRRSDCCGSKIELNPESPNKEPNKEPNKDLGVV
jgi:hypothetical protein